MNHVTVSYVHQAYPRVDEVILTQAPRGKGELSDPCRTVVQVHQKDGTFIAENDPSANLQEEIDGRKHAEAILRRVLQCDKNANILNGAPDLRETIMRLFDPKP